MKAKSLIAIALVLLLNPRATWGQTEKALAARNESVAAIASRDFPALARDLALEKRVVIGVLREPNFSGMESPASLRPEDFLKVWGDRPDVRVVLLDGEQMRSYSILFKGRMDVLVYPYGQNYPMDGFPFYTGQTIAAFLKRGGAVLTTGGVPFGTPQFSDEKRQAEKRTEPRPPDKETYEKFVAALGVKYYVHPHLPTQTRANADFLPGLPGGAAMAPCPLGIVLNNSSHEPEPKPPHGNVFPERYPARQITPLLWGEDDYGQTLAVNALLSQDFETGSRRIHFAQESEPHPLSPASSHFVPLMEDVLRLLKNRLMVKEVESGLACYRQGETVHAQAELVSFESENADAEIVLDILADGKTVFSASRKRTFPPRETVVEKWDWSPPRFDTDEYELIVSLRRDGRTVSSAGNGFVVWNEDVARNGPRVDIKGKYFRLGASDTFVTGTNYYESTRGEAMWFRPDVRRIAGDLRQMRQHGVNFIRPHYHHLKWFKDYLLFQHGRLFDFYKSLENVQSPLPDERAWRTLDMFIYLCQKNGIVFAGDLFTLVPEEMGDPRGWYPVRELVYSPEKRAIQKEFLKQLNVRYQNVPGISWDLWNEGSVPGEPFKEWARDLRKTVQAVAPRFITIGGAPDLGDDAVDYVSPHSRFSNVRDHVNRLNKPLLIQEMHLDVSEGLPEELAQAEDLREGVVAALRNGLAGVAPWSWSRQMRLWQDTYQHHHSFGMEKWDDRLGMHVHDDATIKPAGQVFRDLAALLRTVHLIDFDPATGKVKTDRGELIARLKNEKEGHSVSHVSEDKCFAAMALDSVTFGGKQLMSGPAGGYVYMFGDGNDLATAQRIQAKSDRPGKILIHRAGRPGSVSLVDVTRSGDNKLASLPWAQRDHGIEIDVAPTQQAYWILVDGWTEGASP
ncbi:MAG: hypothetical protein ABIP55_00520 [Tepidisphaeraceae bacterium]